MWMMGITGIDSHFYDLYKKIMKETGNPFYIFYVDCQEGEIYGQSLRDTINQEWDEIIMPCYEADWQRMIPHTLWAINHMRVVRKLTQNEIDYIKERSPTKYNDKYARLTYTIKK